MKFSILTLFPEMFVGPLNHSIIKRARRQKLAEINFVNLRDFARDKYKSVDDHPYGGGPGMILRVDIVASALDSLKRQATSVKPTRQMSRWRSILLDPQGTPYTQSKAQELSQLDRLILVCGHYEGVDDRIRTLVDEELSIGDYILTGGEIPAMVLIDSLVRLLPGVLPKSEASASESFIWQTGGQLLEYPQYTRPAVYKKMKVPEVLLSGNHQKIWKWRQNQSRDRTKAKRPDLLKTTN